MSNGMLIGALLIAALLGAAECAEEIEMRVVNEASSNQQHQQNRNLPKKQPSHFSGPAHLRHLVGRCFELDEGDYLYRLCPFGNVTQQERTAGREAYTYRGVLGVWRGRWLMSDDGDFISQRYVEGDMCGGRPREVTVELECHHDKERVKWVREPEQCRYEMRFASALFCSPMLSVYLLLDPPQRAELKEMRQDHVDGFTTTKGYHILARQLYKRSLNITASFQGDTDNDDIDEEDRGETKTFDTLNECNAEVARLRSLVAQLQAQNNNNG